MATGKPLGEPLRHPDAVQSVAFSPDGTKLATGCDDTTARLWDVASGKPLGERLEHQFSVKAVAFSPDGTYLATASDGTRLWKVDMPPTEPADQLLHWTATMTGLAVDENGLVRVISREEMADRRIRLERAGGPPKAYLDALARRRSDRPTAP